MSAPAARLDHDLTAVMTVVERRTIAFLRDELGLVADGIDRCLRHAAFVELRAITAIVGVGSLSGLYIAYSYDDLLIRAMTRRYTAELTIAPDEEELYVRETASDVVNVIVGNCTADLARREGDQVINLSPPVLIEGARMILGRPETTIATLTLRFPEGSLDVAFVGPRLLFDDHLNYQAGSFLMPLMMTLNVMIVDDSLIMAQKLTVMLRELGHNVVRICRDGAEAVRHYPLINPDLVTMDITMPGMNGMDAMMAILERSADARIIMVTSHGQEAMVVRALEAGAAGYVLKPITKERLAAMVERAMLGVTRR